jgi:hypothetical protein
VARGAALIASLAAGTARAQGEVPPGSEPAGTGAQPGEPGAPAPVEPPPTPVVGADAAPAAPAADEGGSIEYDKGFVLRSADGKFDLKIVGRVQARWELTSLDDGSDKIDHRFSIARARLTLEGQAHGVDYKMQTEFGKGFVFLRDFYLDKGFGGVHLRVGQWKRPFSRQQITSSGSLQMVERASTDAFFKPGRDIGIAIHNNYEKSPELEWALGVFNGTGDKPASKCTTTVDATTMAPTTACDLPSNVPADIGPSLVARVGVNTGGIKGYSESDLEGGPLRLGAAVSYLLNLAEGESDDMVHNLQGDVIVKVEGASATAAVYMIKQKDVDAQIGMHAQAGYFVVPRTTELAIQFSRVPDKAEDEYVHDLLAGASWFQAGHSLKWQTSAGVRMPTVDGGENAFLVLSQAQLIF